MTKKEKEKEERLLDEEKILSKADKVRAKRETQERRQRIKEIGYLGKTAEGRKELRRSMVLLYRTRQDLIKMVNSFRNRAGIKKDGEEQDHAEIRIILKSDKDSLLRRIEDTDVDIHKIELDMLATLKLFSFYTNYLQHVKGVGPALAAMLVALIDPFRGENVSKITQLAGYNSSKVYGQKDIETKKYKPKMGPITREYIRIIDGVKTPRVWYRSTEMIRGDKMIGGFVCPYNADLRKQLYVLSGQFIKLQDNSPYAKIYYDRKQRTSNSDREVFHNKKGSKKSVLVPWKNVSKGHRHHDAIRVMMKHFIKDLYVALRESEGLSVRVPYEEEYLGKKHGSNRTTVAELHQEEPDKEMNQESKNPNIGK